MQNEIWALPNYVDKNPPFDYKNWKSPSTIVSFNKLYVNDQEEDNHHDKRVDSKTKDTARGVVLRETNTRGKTTTKPDKQPGAALDKSMPSARDPSMIARVQSNSEARPRTSDRSSSKSQEVGPPLEKFASKSSHSTARRDRIAHGKSSGSKKPSLHSSNRPRVVPDYQASRADTSFSTTTSFAKTTVSKVTERSAVSAEATPTIYAGRGWVTPHCLSESEVQSAISLPPAEGRPSRRMTYQEYCAAKTRSSARTDSPSTNLNDSYTSHSMRSHSKVESLNNTARSPAYSPQSHTGTTSSKPLSSFQNSDGSSKQLFGSRTLRSSELFYVNSNGQLQFRMPWDEGRE